MSEVRKREVVELLKKIGIDPLNIERELLSLLRNEPSSLKVREYLKKLLEGEKR